jgi:hypothetical protein
MAFLFGVLCYLVVAIGLALGCLCTANVLSPSNSAALTGRLFGTIGIVMIVICPIGAALIAAIEKRLAVGRDGADRPVCL